MQLHKRTLKAVPDFLFLYFMEISLLHALCLQTYFIGDILKYEGDTRTWNEFYLFWKKRFQFQFKLSILYSQLNSSFKLSWNFCSNRTIQFKLYFPYTVKFSRIDAWKGFYRMREWCMKRRWKFLSLDLAVQDTKREQK